MSNDTNQTQHTNNEGAHTMSNDTTTDTIKAAIMEHGVPEAAVLNTYRGRPGCGCGCRGTYSSGARAITLRTDVVNMYLRSHPEYVSVSGPCTGYGEDVVCVAVDDDEENRSVWLYVNAAALPERTNMPRTLDRLAYNRTATRLTWNTHVDGTGTAAEPNLARTAAVDVLVVSATHFTFEVLEPYCNSERNPVREGDTITIPYECVVSARAVVCTACGATVEARLYDRDAHLCRPCLDVHYQERLRMTLRDALSDLWASSDDPMDALVEAVSVDMRDVLPRLVEAVDRAAEQARNMR